VEVSVQDNPVIPPDQLPPPSHPQPRAFVGPSSSWTVEEGDQGWDAHIEGLDGRMTEHVHTDTVSEAVAWATARCTWVLVAAGGRHWWAGTEPRPPDLEADWPVQD
jgi:hypothetical protein